MKPACLAECGGAQGIWCISEGRVAAIRLAQGGIGSARCLVFAKVLAVGTSKRRCAGLVSV